MIMIQTLFVLLIYFTLVYFFAQWKENNGLVDVAWGMGFVVAAIYTFLVGGIQGPRSLLVTFLVLLWGLRLSYHLFKRNWNRPEDRRYVEMRARWQSSRPKLTAFFRIYMLQMLLLFIIVRPVIIINTSQQTSLGWLDVLALAVWVFGYFFEVLGDAQLKAFLSHPENKGHLMKEGLWAWTRHPNYFGEATMWWGIYLLAFSVPGGPLSIFSPILITFLLLFVSGVPLLEKKYQNHPEWPDYAAKTNRFIPWFPKK